MTLKQIADESGLNKSTALRMTTTLLNEKFLSYNEETRKYQLGYCALALGISKLASIDLIEVSRPILEELANRSNMFIHLAILEDEKVVVISKIFPKARMQSTTRASSNSSHDNCRKPRQENCNVQICRRNCRKIPMIVHDHRDFVSLF